MYETNKTQLDTFHWHYFLLLYAIRSLSSIHRILLWLWVFSMSETKIECFFLAVSVESSHPWLMVRTVFASKIPNHFFLIPFSTRHLDRTNGKVFHSPSNDKRNCTAKIRTMENLENTKWESQQTQKDTAKLHSVGYIKRVHFFVFSALWRWAEQSIARSERERKILIGCVFNACN